MYSSFFVYFFVFITHVEVFLLFFNLGAHAPQRPNVPSSFLIKKNKENKVNRTPQCPK